MRTYVTFIFVCILIALSTASSIAQSVHLKGKVIDEFGQPMEMVHVRLQREALGTTTNFKGEYELNVPATDTLRVIFTFIGYKRTEKVINTSSGNKTAKLDVQMSPNNAYINDVEVVTQRQQNGTGEKIEAKNIRKMPTASGNAVEDMLGTMAGVTMNNEMSSQYSVRGGSFDENLVYVNGIEIYRPQLISSGQQEGLSFINPEMVREVNFSTGGFAATYGDKMSSVLDITYKRPDSLEAHANVSFMGASASLGQRTRNFSQLHGIRFKRNASLLSSLDTKGEYDPRFFDYQTLLGFDFNEKWDIQLLGNIATNHYNFTPKTRETSFGTMDDAHSFKVYFDGSERDIFDTYFGALTLNYKRIKNTQLSLMASAFATDEQVTYDIAGEYWLDEATDGGQSSLGVGAYHEHARNSLNASVLALSLKGVSQIGYQKLSYGINIQQEKIDDRISEWERRDSSGYTLPHTGDKVQMIYNLHSFYNNTTTRWSAYLQDQVGWDAPNGRFLMIAGVRMSHWSFNGETLLSPRFMLQYRPTTSRFASSPLTLRVATGLYYQSPFYKEYRLSYRDEEGNTMVRMNNNIQSQRSYQIVMGADYTFKAYDRPFKFTAEAYYKNISNYIPYTVDNVQIRYLGYNQGSAYNTGIDMKLFGEFVPGTDSWVSLSLMQAKEKYDGITTPRPTEQRYSLGIFFSDYWPGNDAYKVFLRGVMNDGLPFYSPIGGRQSGIFRTPAYKRVDMGVSRVWNKDNSRFLNQKQWRWLKEATLGLDVFNLLDNDNINSYYWVTAVNNTQYAVPNYLTSRTISMSLTIRM